MSFLNDYIDLGIGDWGLGPIPNPQSPIPIIIIILLIYNRIHLI